MSAPAPGTDPRRSLPRVDDVADALAPGAAYLGRPEVVAAARTALEALRGEVTGDADGGLPAGDDLHARALALARAALPARAASLRLVLNATGVVVHTNLGRAPLSAVAVEALRVAAGTCDVELDLGTARRGRRGAGALAALSARLPGAPAALVVNNGAAALLLAVTALAAGRTALLSRGEMVEIGDGFRLPTLLISTGARLREVGTTNRTTVRDYLEAMDDDVACILKIHPSNFRVVGFRGEATAADLARADLGVPLVVDTGSGLLRDDPALPDEPSVAAALEAGADLVTSSTDKLLGGPQGGLLVGRPDLVEACRRHPLARALRADKLALAALEATLRGPAPPVQCALQADAETLRHRCSVLAVALREAGVAADVVASDGVVGGGGAPGVALPGWAVALDPALAAPLRTRDPAVLGRVSDGRLLLDLRCVAPADDDLVARAVTACATPRDTPAENAVLHP